MRLAILATLWLIALPVAAEAQYSTRDATDKGVWFDATGAGTQANPFVPGTAFGHVKTVTVTSNLTAGNTYGAGKVVGGNVIGGNGVWTFANALPTGSGRVVRIVATVRGPTNGTANFTTPPTFGFAFYAANPTNSTFTDTALGNLAFADAGKIANQTTLAPVQTNTGSATGSSYTSSITFNPGTADRTAPDTNVYLVVISTNTMSPGYTNAGDLSISITTEY